VEVSNILPVIDVGTLTQFGRSRLAGPGIRARRSRDRRSPRRRVGIQLAGDGGCFAFGRPTRTTLRPSLVSLRAAAPMPSLAPVSTIVLRTTVVTILSIAVLLSG
jgi:hypothetical protein